MTEHFGAELHPLFEFEAGSPYVGTRLRGLNNMHDPFIGHSQ